MAAASSGFPLTIVPDPVSSQSPDVDHKGIYLAGLDNDNKENMSGKARPPPLDISGVQNVNAGPVTPTSTTPRTPRVSRIEGERKIGHRRVDEEGQVSYKKIQSTQIMCSIQLGISHSVGGLASKPERDVLMHDFAVIEQTYFPGDGSSNTPAHRFADFRFKTYAPVAFRYFRDLFGIQPDDYLLSMCNEPLRELSNPGASGSIFYVTQDDEFIIKTVQHKEGEFLQKLLPGYYMNLNQNPRTLLPKFFGLYCYQCGGKNIRLAAMNNLLPSSVKIHQKYDLKGSTYKRKASRRERSKPSPTYKDLDFLEHHSEGILLEAETYNALVKTMLRDCRVLESFKIMDYSLLLGIHNLDQAARDRAEQMAKHVESAHAQAASASASADGAGPSHSSAGLMRTKSTNRQKLVAHSTAMEAIQAEVEPIDEEEDVPPGGIPARNAKGERLLLYVGIIDILQSYRLRKKLEHTWKAMLHDGDTVSVHRPAFYAQRFQDFMAKAVFKKIPSLDLPEIKGPHRRFRALVSSYIALKHSPSRKKNASVRHRPPASSGEGRSSEDTTFAAEASALDSLAGSPTSGYSSEAPTNPPTSLPLPAVLQNRVAGVSTKQRVPPPVPPRASLQRSKDQGSASGRSDLPASSTPPPSFEEAIREPLGLTKQRSNTDPVVAHLSERTRTKMSTSSVVSAHSDRADAVSVPSSETRQLVASKVALRASTGVVSHKCASISHITLKTDSTLSTQSITSESSSTTSGISSTIRTATWTPPHSVEGSTPTHTEGTPSFTESSSSGDLGCPTTPIRGIVAKEANIRSSMEPLPYQETEMTHL